MLSLELLHGQGTGVIMEIDNKELTTLIEEAFDSGASNCKELKKQIIKDLCIKYKINGSETYKIWKVEDLKKLPVGTVFNHVSKGRCWIAERSNGVKYMQFVKGDPAEFCFDEFPWNSPMMLMYSSI